MAVCTDILNTALDIQGAKKRMDREDVFGSKIVVGFPPKVDSHDNDGRKGITTARFFEQNGYSNIPCKPGVQIDDRARSPSSPSRRNYRKTDFPPPPSAPTVLMDSVNSLTATWTNVFEKGVHDFSSGVFGQRSASTSFVPPPSNDIPQMTYDSFSRDGSASPQRYLHWKPLIASCRDEGSSEPFSSRCSTASTCSSDGSREPVPSKCAVMDRPPDKSRHMRGLNKGLYKSGKDSSGERGGRLSTSPSCRKKPTHVPHEPLRERKPRRSLPDQNLRHSPNHQFTNSRPWATIGQDNGIKSSRNGLSFSSSTSGISPFATMPISARPCSPQLCGHVTNRDSLFQPIELNQSSSITTENGDQGVELMVTNLDQNYDVKEMKKLLFSHFGQHVMVLHVSVILNPEGNLSAIVKVPTMQDAQYVISQLHRRKIGFKRILISFANNNASALPVLRTETVALLSDVPGHRLPLFKFKELFEKRYHQSISASELNKLKDVIIIQEEAGGRMVCLNPNYRDTPSPASSEGSKEVQAIMEKSFCEIHCPNPNVGKGWAEKESLKTLPNFNISLKTLAPRVHSLLHSHNGLLPLGSFPVCYQHEFNCLEEVPEGGVPLEHLIASIPGVKISQSSSGGKRVQWTENKAGTPTALETWRSASPPLAAQLALFSREVVDLLKNTPYCLMPFNKFIPAYHHHFGRQCRVADYGYTKLIELFDAVSHIIQIIGEGNRRFLTLTHRSQVKRFTSDLLRILKSQLSKQVSLKEFSAVYSKCLGKEFDVTNYGICDIQDLFNEIPENTVMITTGAETVISIIKREQTNDEMERTKQFAIEVVELLKHSPHCRMSFSKFIPSYHHHFGQQCRVADYGFCKLMELFEAIPDVLEVHGEGDDKWLVLSEREILKVLSNQIAVLVRSTKDAGIPLDSLLSEFLKYHGHNIILEDYKVRDVNELLAKISETVKVIQTNEGPMVTLVDRGYVKQLSLNVRRLLMEQPDCKMEISEFCQKYRQRFDEPCNIMQVTIDLEDVAEVEGSIEAGVLKLNSLQMFARNVYILLHECGGKILLHQFDGVYLERFGVQCRPSLYGFSGLGTLFQAIPDVAYVRGKGHKKVILLNRETAGTPLYGIHVKNMQKANLAMMCTNKAFMAKLEKRPSSTDSAVVDEDEELLQIICSPVDLLSDPVPSCVPSPSLHPCPTQPTIRDLIRFDSPLEVSDGDRDPGPVSSSNCPPPPSNGVSTQDSLANALLRTLVLSAPLPKVERVSGATPGASVPDLSMTSHFETSPPPNAMVDTTLAVTTTPPRSTSTPCGTPTRLKGSQVETPQEGDSSKSLIHSCDDLAACSDFSAISTIENTLTSSQSTPSKARPRLRSRIAAHFSNPPTVGSDQ